MKKIILGMLLMGVVSIADTIEVKAGWDINGKYHIDINNNSSLKAKTNSVEVGAEYRKDVLVEGLQIGAGVAFQAHKKTKSGYELTNSVPVYATAKYNFYTGFNPLNIKPFVKADLGYSFNTNDVDDGIYYGVGGGIDFNNFSASLMYKRNNGDLERSFRDIKANYDRVTLGLGYNFGF